eukprot:2033000-Ditylum_brightwellii.AAC.1
MKQKAPIVWGTCACQQLGAVFDASGGGGEDRGGHGGTGGTEGPPAGAGDRYGVVGRPGLNWDCCVDVRAD